MCSCRPICIRNVLLYSNVLGIKHNEINVSPETVDDARSLLLPFVIRLVDCNDVYSETGWRTKFTWRTSWTELYWCLGNSVRWLLFRQGRNSSLPHSRFRVSFTDSICCVYDSLWHPQCMLRFSLILSDWLWHYYTQLYSKSKTKTIEKKRSHQTKAETRKNYM